MSSRTYRRTLALTLALSAGTLALPPAQAAPARSGPASGVFAIQDQPFTRSFFEALKRLPGWLRDSQNPPNDPGHNPGDHSGSNNREGSGVCPHGGGPHGGGNG